MNFVTWVQSVFIRQRIKSNPITHRGINMVHMLPESGKFECQKQEDWWTREKSRTRWEEKYTWQSSAQSHKVDNISETER